LATTLGALSGAVAGWVIGPEGAEPIVGGAVIGGLGVLAFAVVYRFLSAVDN
jgi:hypothetical protein